MNSPLWIFLQETLMNDKIKIISTTVTWYSGVLSQVLIAIAVKYSI